MPSANAVRSWAVMHGRFSHSTSGDLPNSPHGRQWVFVVCRLSQGMGTGDEFRGRTKYR
jgi:hypothetical protein